MVKNKNKYLHQRSETSTYASADLTILHNINLSFETWSCLDYVFSLCIKDVFIAAFLMGDGFLFFLM